MDTHTPNMLAPPQPKKSRSSGPTANGEYIMEQPMYSSPVAHNPHLQQNPAVNTGGNAGGLSMNPGGYHGGGAGPYPTNHPQQYPANHATHTQMPGSMYRMDVYSRIPQPMAHSGAPGSMHGVYDARSDAMYNQAYSQRRFGGPMSYPTPNAVVTHPRPDGYPQGSSNMHGGQYMYSHSQMAPSSMNYSIATSGDPTPTQPTLQSSSGQQAALSTAGNQASTAAPVPGAAYSSHIAPAAPASSVVSSNSAQVDNNSWSNLSQPPHAGPASAPATGSSVSTGTVNPSDVPSSLANSAPPSSVVTEGMNSVNQTIPTSSTSSPAAQSGNAPQRTPIQPVATQVTPSPTPPSMNQVSSVSNIAGVSGQPMPAVGGLQQQGLPAATSAAREGFGPQSMQQQPPFVRLQGSALRNDGDMALPPVLQGNGGLPQRPGLDDRLPSSSSSNPSTPGGGGAVNPDQEKTKLIQQQLVLLLHAHKCLQRERESENYRCNLPHCQVMKEVFRHIMQCTRARDCSYPHCASSRQIIQHWKSCGKHDCSICMPVKGVIKPVNAQSGAGHGVAGVSGVVPGTISGPVAPSTSMPMQAHPSTMGQPSAPGEQWQISVRQDVRDHLIKKILNGIYPVNDYNSAMNHPQYSRLVQYIRRLEDNFFKTCISKDEYFSKLADKYQQIVKDLQRTSPGGHAGMNPMVQQAHLPTVSNQWSPASQIPGQRPPMPMSVSSTPGSVPNVKSVDSGLPPSAASQLPLDIAGPQSASQTPASTDPIPAQNAGPADLKSPVSSQQSEVAVKQEVDGSLTEPRPSVEMNRRPSITSPTSGNDVNAHTQPLAAEAVDKVQQLPLASPTTEIPPQTVKTPTSAAPTVKVVPNPALKRVFTREEMEAALRPVFTHIWEQPDAWPFQEPVNPDRLNIPDYFAIVKEPMDLGTIDRKLSGGVYKNPWEFCKDFWLMIDNAWLYNRKTSKVYRMCSKLFEVFNEVIDGAMKSLGYCCGQRYTYSPQVLYCYSKNLCPIPRDASYFGCDSRYLFCTKCFLEIPGETVSIGDDGYNTTTIEKSKFQELKNDHVEQEPMLDCIHCGRTFHKACVLWHENIWPEGYQCNSCLSALGTVRKDNKFAAKKLPTTQLGTHLEKRVNNFLQSSGSGAGEITIRVVSSSSKMIETKPGMREKYAGEFPMEMPYRTKAMFVFEEIDGVDVCFFGMHVQEYSSDCPTPNTRRVYISYLDSVHFFQPREYRTVVYHEIIIGYMEFVKKQGFSTAHIWACPPSEGDDYIFHCHPAEQKIPKPKRLVDWYRNMLERGKDQGVVHSYMDFYEYCQKEELTSPDQLPYFEGDFWPNVIEEQIKELDHELEEERKAEAEEADVHNSKKGASKRSSNKKANSKKAGKSKQVKKVGDLSQRIFSIMDKHREVFFVVQLHDPSTMLTEPTGDPDPLLTCDLMEGRDAFLTLAREKHWEFSSLRRAKYSTLAMLVTLHTQGGDRFLYTCNMCQQPVETRYHCTECEDFDLCVSCYEKHGHEHTMTRLGMDLDIPDEGAGPKDLKEALSRAIDRFIQVLVHAAQCRDRNCKSPSCAKMKRIMHHIGRCKQCTVCKQFLALCLQHAKTCKSTNCPVPLCANLKKHLLDKQRQASFQESRFAARRMIAMRMAMPTTSPSLGGGSSSNGGAPVQSPAPNTPIRQQPSTPTPKTQPLQQQVSNSPAPSPAVRNPASVPPPSVSHQSPGGKALGTLQQNQEAPPSHGPPSIPSKPMMAATPSPHPATPASYQQPHSVGPPSVGTPQGREHIMTIRKNPQHALETLAQHSYPHGQPQPQPMRQIIPGQTVASRYPTQMASNPQPYPSTHPHSAYMDGSAGATMSTAYRYAPAPQRVAPHPAYTQQQPGGQMYLQNQSAYGSPAMTSQQMYNRDAMMVHSNRPVMYGGGVGGGGVQGSYHPTMQQQQQQQVMQRPQQMSMAASSMTPMGGGMGISVHPQQHQQRYQSVAPGGPPMGAGYQQQQQQLYPPNAMPPQQPQAAHHHGEPTLNPGYQGQFQPGYSNVDRLDQVANQL